MNVIRCGGLGVRSNKGAREASGTPWIAPTRRNGDERWSSLHLDRSHFSGVGLNGSEFTYIFYFRLVRRVLTSDAFNLGLDLIEDILRFQ